MSNGDPQPQVVSIDEVRAALDPTKNRWLYFLTLSIIGAALLFSLVAWFVMVLDGKTMPEGFAVVVGTLAGGLVGVITSPSGGSS